MIKKIIKFGVKVLLIAAVANIAGCADEASNEGGSGPINVDIVDMIDDLEDGDDVIIQTEERSGDWYTYNDGSAGGVQTPEGSCTPSSGGAEGTSFAMNTTGSGWSDWGAGLGFDLNVDGGEGTLKGTFDASGYNGIAFHAKGSGTIRAQILIPALIAEEEGGTCVEGATDAEQCSNGHGIFVNLESDWNQYGLDFATITQDEGWGQEVDFDPSQIVTVLWHVEAGADFDVWIDEVGFY